MKSSSSHQLPTLRLKLAAVVSGVLLGLTVFAGAAQACDYPEGEPVFSAWGDSHDYALGPDGGFEAGGAGWALSGGAEVVAGNESYYLNDASDSYSLSLPAGSTAGSPPVCMSIDTPNFRMLARNTGNPASQLRVEAIFRLRSFRTNVVKTLTAGPSWQPTKQIWTLQGLSNIIGVFIPSAIEIRLTPLDATGQWQVDDLYIDPFARH